MAIVIAAAMGTLMILLVIYACIVASSRMDDQYAKRRGLSWLSV